MGGYDAGLLNGFVLFRDNVPKKLVFSFLIVTFGVPIRSVWAKKTTPIKMNEM